MSTTSYLVTGGAGFIGSHIAAALIARGDRVRVFDNLSTGRRENLDAIPGAEVVIADLLDRDALARSMKSVDVVYHQAALPSVPRSVESPEESHAACVTGTLNVLDMARRCGVRRVVYAGSSSAYGNQPHMSKRESDSPTPLSPYAAAKLAGEYYCRAFANTYKLETVTIRYFNVFGPRQDPNGAYSAVIPRFVTAMLAGHRPTVYGDGLQSRDFTYVDNVVAANLAAGSKPGLSGRTINAACGRQTTLSELIEALGRLLGANVEPKFAPPRTSDPRESLADISLARRLLDYEPRVGLVEGLQRSIDYYRSVSTTEPALKCA